MKKLCVRVSFACPLNLVIEVIRLAVDYFPAEMTTTLKICPPIRIRITLRNNKTSRTWGLKFKKLYARMGYACLLNFVIEVKLLTVDYFPLEMTTILKICPPTRIRHSFFALFIIFHVFLLTVLECGFILLNTVPQFPPLTICFENSLFCAENE